LVPERRKKRSYISSILAKNEVTREGPYNRKLFLRIGHGQYLPNPRLALRVAGEWRTLYELLVPQRLAFPYDASFAAPYEGVADLNRIIEERLVRLRELLPQLAREAVGPKIPQIAAEAARPGPVRGRRKTP